MNGKQLKNSILQWAIQGKLVPQDPNDEPASVLLERIRAEKARLVKEKKIKKDKNESIIYRGDDNSYYEKFLATGEVKCIDEEIPFEIPNGWQWERIGNIFETTSGSTPLSRNPDYYKNGNINWVRTTDLNNGILNKTEIQITSKAIIDYNLSILPQTSVCVAMYGGAGTIGKHCILHFDTTINQSVCAIQPNGFCNMDYIHTFIEYQRPFWMDFAAGSRKDPNINQLIIKHCLLPIPPQEEQLRIVTKLNQLYPYIYQYGNSQNRLNQINKEIWHSLKKSILQEAIQGKLVPQIAEEGTAQELLEQIRQEKLQLVKEGKLKKSALTDSIIFRGDDNKYFEKVGKTEQDITDEIPFEIPDDWKWCRIGSVLNIWSARRVHERDWRSSGIPFYRAREIGKMADWGHVDNDLFIEQSLYDEFSKSGVPQIGDLMMTAVGTLGKTYVVETNNPFYYKDGSVLCIGNPFRLNPYYLKLFFESSAFANQYLSESDGTTVATLTMVRLNRYLIPVPPLKEQTRIVEKIKTVTSIMRG
ncbi:restriction endonuclease subunit S [Phocaeicola vulgatus]|jgi:type I restriction enzyme S subunit|uniref:Restriction endonuclease subunit S n=1 Tax=Phocaeicola vulgatus TaxID=821 RepID=A0AAW5AT72_PHOVU|nr:restriction endonuclease subunit S [Phocaeicola vulgatus]MCG0147476.1 restriction endonuclease subunit S [Phocaeicola vulgatus]MCG0341116.1 restriction endonuclease subunit S [Phocaeicola vulgatus]RGW04500.1 restriction endonuclease subunit S [Phocaeicola vulgatus]